MAKLLGLALLGLFFVGGVRADYPKSTKTVVVSTTTTIAVQYYPSPNPNIVNVCTTTHTQWVDWRAAPTPGLDFRLTCENGPWSSGHEIAYIPESALVDQELEARYFQWTGMSKDADWNTLYMCCETCLDSTGCAAYQFSEKDGGVCKQYFVKKGTGSKALTYCPAGIFEIESGPPQLHRPRNETGTGWEQLYAGGILPGPCYSAGRLSSYECSDGTWAGPGPDYIEDP